MLRRYSMHPQSSVRWHHLYIISEMLQYTFPLCNCVFLSLNDILRKLLDTGFWICLTEAISLMLFLCYNIHEINLFVRNIIYSKGLYNLMIGRLVNG